jgi:2'-5' RNA ligase
LYFLGSRNEEEILKIKQKIDKYVNILKGSRVKIKSLGNFGNKNRRVIFLKVYHDSVLEKFYEKIKSELDSYREESRKFKPHLTLGRIRKNHFYKNIKPKLIDVIKETEYDFEIKNIDIYGRKNMREPQKILHTTPVMNA